MNIIYRSKCEKISITEGKTAVALGNFDGVHIGHQALLSAICGREGYIPSVYTFEIHTQNAVPGNNTAKCLYDNEQKINAFESSGVKTLIFEDFKRVRELSPKEFVKNILVDELNCGYAVCGYNFKFGKNCSGNSELLKKELSEYGIDCKIISPVMFAGEPVSSTRIRKLLELGDTELANQLLGRPFSIRREVIGGQKLGRTLNAPTVNQAVGDSMAYPKIGVYACKVKVGDNLYIGVCDVGTKPTVGGNELLCETHIIDYSGNLYGQTVETLFYKRIRDEVRFESVEELKKQIMSDVESVKKYFAR